MNAIRMASYFINLRVFIKWNYIHSCKGKIINLFIFLFSVLANIQMYVFVYWQPCFTLVQDSTLSMHAQAWFINQYPLMRKKRSIPQRLHSTIHFFFTGIPNGNRVRKHLYIFSTYICLYSRTEIRIINLWAVHACWFTNQFASNTMRYTEVPRYKYKLINQFPVNKNKYTFYF